MKYYNIINYGPIRDNLYIIIPITIIYVIIFITGLIGNTSTCIVITRKKSMHTAINYYLYSLSIANLVLLIFGLAPEIYLLFPSNQYVFSYTFCILSGLLTETSTNATVLTMIAFTADRYLIICHPFFPSYSFKLSRVIKLIVLIWLVAICCAIPQAFQFSEMKDDPGSVVCHIMKPIMNFSFSEIFTCAFFIISITILTILYVMIGFKLRLAKRNNRIIRNLERVYHATDSGYIYKPHGKSSQRIVKMLFAVVVAFFICWIPFHIQRLAAIYIFPNNDENSNSFKTYEVARYVTRTLYFISLTINPILYISMSAKFREAVKVTFSSCCKFTRPTTFDAMEMNPVCSQSPKRFREPGDFDGNEPTLQTDMAKANKGSTDPIYFQSPGRSSLMDSKDQYQIQESYICTRGESSCYVTKVTLKKNKEQCSNTKIEAVDVTRLPTSNTENTCLFLTCKKKTDKTNVVSEIDSNDEECKTKPSSTRSIEEISNSSLIECDIYAITKDLET